MLWRRGDGTSSTELNGEIEEVLEGGRRYLKVPPIRPDLVFLHAPEADVHGNVLTASEAYLGRTFSERALALASRGPVVASVERLVSNDVVVAEPYRTLVRGALVTVIPGGSHPGGTSGRFIPDLEHYAEYCEAGEERRRGDPVPYQRYLERYVYGPQDHEDYLRMIGVDRLDRLRMEGW